MVLFQDSDFAGDPEDSKSSSVGTSCVFGSHTVCSKKLDVEETNFSFSQFNGIRNHFLVGLRLDGIPALDSWDLIVSVLGNTNQSDKEQGDPFMNKREVRSTCQ